MRVKGWAASMGSKLTDKTPADADAPAVARLREAGAIVFAQSTSSEYGHKGVTDSPLHGITRNPVEHRAHAGRLLGRRGCGGGRGPGADRHRHRRRRLGAHPLELQRPGRHQGHVRPRAGLAAVDDRRSLQHRPDVPHRARLRADDERDRPARSARCLCAAGRRHRLCQGDRRQAEEAESRLRAALRRPSARHRGRGAGDQGRQAIREAGLQGRGGRRRPSPTPTPAAPS